MSDEQATPQYPGEFFCVWCQSVIRTETMDYPTACPHCAMVRCEKCSTYLKGPSPKFCHGCAAIPPTVRPNIYRTDSIGGCYANTHWVKQHTLGFEAAKDRNAPYGYAVSIKQAHYLCRDDFQRIRDLTPDECDTLGIKRSETTTEPTS